MEKFKSLDKLFEPDERWSFFVNIDLKTGTKMPISLEQRYKEVAGINLNCQAPEAVQSQFNVAKMLCIYAWLYFPFHQIADLKAFSTVEMALRLRFPGRREMLKNLLQKAINAGVITDHGFSHIAQDQNDPQRYSKTLPDCIPGLRNSLAHGSTLLHPSSIFTLQNCAEIINQIYPIPTKSE